MKTLKLDSNWDLTVDAFGNIALGDADESIAQDVASAVRTFLGECWYNTLLGLPYFESILGKRPATSFLKSKIQAAALSVPEVTGVSVVNLGLANRKLTGTIYVTTAIGATPIEVTF
jgi:hypothetical protein